MVAERVKYPFTVQDYHRMTEAGIFHEDDRVELLEGEIIEIAPRDSCHAGGVNCLLNAFLPLQAERKAIESIGRCVRRQAVISRRGFLQLGTAGAGIFLSRKFGFTRRASAGRLDPTTVSKYVTPLAIPPAMPRVAALQNNSIDCYLIAVRQFKQQILPPDKPMTTVWNYGSIKLQSTFHYPAFTIEAKVDTPVHVKWINDLVDGSGNFLPHLLSVDPTLHWATPPSGADGRDRRPEFAETPGL
jgi:hypothetical protein